MLRSKMKAYEDSGEELVAQAKEITPINLCGTSELIKLSNENWAKKCQLLKKAITQFNNEEARCLYKEGLELKKYEVDCTEFLIFCEKKHLDEKSVRAFHWEHLAAEDKKERELLIQAYEQGRKVPLNKIRADYWRNYEEKS